MRGPVNLDSANSNYIRVKGSFSESDSRGVKLSNIAADSGFILVPSLYDDNDCEILKYFTLDNIGIFYSSLGWHLYRRK